MIEMRSVCLVLVAVLAFACLHQMDARAQKVDAADPESVAAYRDDFRASAQTRCTIDVEQRILAEGKAFAAREKSVAEKFCTCSVDGVMALVPDDQVEALRMVMVEPSLKPHRQQIVADCARSVDTTSN